MPNGLGLVLPLVDPAHALTLSVYADCDTELQYRVYQPERGYGFAPDRLINSGSVSVHASDAWQEVAIPVMDLVAGSYYFFALEPNAALHLQSASRILPTAQLFYRFENHQTNAWSYDEMGMQGYAYNRDMRFPHVRFDTPQNAYTPEKVINGYNRAFCQPNLWLSDPQDEMPTLTLRWDKPVRLSMVQITFAIDTTTSIEHYPKRIFDNIACDYQVYGMLEGAQTLLADVRNNHHKQNRIAFKAHLVDEIRFEFHRCEGGQVAVYEVRAELDESKKGS